MAAINPTPEIFKMSLKEIYRIFFVNEKTIHMVTAVIKSRYQTNKPSFRVINLPKTPVKPARKMAMCNCISAFFMCIKETAKISSLYAMRCLQFIKNR